MCSSDLETAAQKTFGEEVSGQEACGEKAACPETSGEKAAGQESSGKEAAANVSGKEMTGQETAQTANCCAAASGETSNGTDSAPEPDKAAETRTASGPADGKTVAEEALKKVFEEGRIAGLQEAILAIMEKNGPITDQMRRDVAENVYHDSLIAWVKSFR